VLVRETVYYASDLMDGYNLHFSLDCNCMLVFLGVVTWDLVVLIRLYTVITDCPLKDFCEPIAVSDEHSMQTGGFRRVAIAVGVVPVSPGCR
jgi:hypothetical protein